MNIRDTLEQQDKDVAVKFANWCADRVISVYEDVEPTDTRVRDVVEADDMTVLYEEAGNAATEVAQTDQFAASAAIAAKHAGETKHANTATEYALKASQTAAMAADAKDSVPNGYQTEVAAQEVFLQTLIE
ncbi:MAG: hypothetical protein ACR2MX_01620 [Cyclobacteriaceae bacterium]